MSLNTSRTLLLVVCMAVVGCDSPDEAPGEAAGFIQSDSAGVTLAFSRSPRQGSGLFRLDSLPRMAFSESPGGGEVLDGVRDARRLDDGRIVVLNGKPPTILLIDQGGNVVRRIGRIGSGPGEYRSPMNLRVSRDSIAVWDQMFGPRNVFDTAGKVLSTRSFDLELIRRALGDSLYSETQIPFAMSGLLIPARFTGGDRVLTEPHGGQRNDGRLVMVDDASLSRQWTIDHPGRVFYPLNVGSRPVQVLPFVFVGALAAIDETSRVVMVGDGTTPHVDIYSAGGSLLMSVRWDADLRRSTPDEYARMKTRWLSQTGAVARVADAGALLKEIPDQRTFPPVLGIVPDGSGGFWVRAGITQWDVFSSEGEWITQIELPFRKLFQIGKDFVLGLEIDNDGIESISEYRLSTR